MATQETRPVAWRSLDASQMQQWRELEPLYEGTGQQRTWRCSCRRRRSKAWSKKADQTARQPLARSALRQDLMPVRL